MYKATQEDVIGIIKPANYSPFAEFHSYILDFYGEGGIYDYGFTHDEITEATILLIQSGADFEGDSVDREKVRDIVLETIRKR